MAARMPNAIGRSDNAPRLPMSAGVRVTLTRPSGNAKPARRIAPRTLLRHSPTRVSASPTTSKSGSPPDTSTSISTTDASTPVSPADLTLIMFHL